MNSIQIYIGDARLDLFDDESISVTQTIQNVKDISKIFTDFSQTFTVPASPKNNTIFKHYYNYDIVNGFEGRNKSEGRIDLSMSIFKKGYIQLMSCQLKENKPYSYKITFYGNASIIKDKIGDSKLSDLETLNELSFNYSGANIQSRLSLDPTTNDLVVPLITCLDISDLEDLDNPRLYYDSVSHTSTGNGDGNLFYSSGHKHGLRYNQVKPAIRVDRIIQAIEEDYNIVFDRTGFFDTSNTPYYNMFMWISKDKGKIRYRGEDDPSYNIQINNFVDEDLGNPTSDIVYLGTPSKIYNPTRATYQKTITINTTDNSTPYKITILKNSQIWWEKEGLTGSQVLNVEDFGMKPQAGIYEYSITCGSAIIFTKFDIEFIHTTKSGLVSHLFSSTGVSITENFRYELTEQLPDMSILDFLTGLFKMFNLTAYIKNNGDIAIETLNSYYYGGKEWDITKYVDTSESEVAVSIPFKQIDFNYSGNKTLNVDKLSQTTNAIWGQTTYDAGIENLGNSTFKLDLPFSHMQFERLKNEGTSTYTPIQIGRSVGIELKEISEAPLMFYPIKVAQTIGFKNLDGAYAVEVTNINVPSNTLSLASGTYKDSLHYKEEFSEYLVGSETSIEFTDTLYSKYYNEYISNIFDPKQRLITLTAYLPNSILLNYSLADIFIVNNKKYRINSIVSELTSNKSRLELLVHTKLEEVTIPISGENPIISVIGGNVTVEAGTTYTDLGATATDAEDGDLTSSIVVTNNVNTSNYGNAQFVIYNVTDSSGLSATAYRMVTIQDTIAPTGVSVVRNQNLLVTINSIPVRITGADSGSGIKTFSLYVKEHYGGVLYTLQGVYYREVDAVITGLNPATKYDFYVVAKDVAGNSTTSAIASDTTATSIKIDPNSI